MISFEDKPIIVLGVNHSGTRLVVDILSALGSNAGDNQNEWKESELFIKAHYILLNCSNSSEWNKKIFDLSLYQSSALSYDEKAVSNFLDENLDISFPNRKSAPWHWKCPSSALFLDFWIKQFPDAYYIHVVRNRYDVAYSLMRRKQFRSLRKALCFYRLFEKKISCIYHQEVKSLKLNYENIENEIERITDFVPCLTGDIDPARKLIKRKELSFEWSWDKTIKTNLWNIYNVLRISCLRSRDNRNI